MALDTAKRRNIALGFGQSYRGGSLPFPDANLDASDRAALLGVRNVLPEGVAQVSVTVRAFTSGWFGEVYRVKGDTFAITTPQQYSPYWMTFVDAIPPSWAPFLAVFVAAIDREILEF